MLPPARPRSLIVEDDAAVRASLVLLLAVMGIDAIGLPDGYTALDLARREPFDFFMIDLGLPDMDGLALSHALHAAAPDTPIVMISGDSDRLGSGLGVAAHRIRKPVPAAMLRATIGEILPHAFGAAPAA